jgi:two-component system response regulator
MSADIAVFIVEDNPDHRELIVDAFAQCCDASRIATAADGEEALDYLFGRGAHAGRDPRKQPRLVILDIDLPRMHGPDVLKAMRADPLTSSTPVIMLTGSLEKSVLDGCYAAGANSVVRKTADYDELATKMRRAWDFWITVNEGDRHSRV